MIQRKVQVVPPFYCHPDHGCRDLDCGGLGPATTTALAPTSGTSPWFTPSTDTR